jgi:signal transduction histidine kinase
LRFTFVLLRALTYGVLFVSAFVHDWDRPWWQWLFSVVVAAWTIWDQWKRADDAVATLRRGVWIELGCVLLWGLILQNGVVLFALLSPLTRTCVHLKGRDCLGVLLFVIASILGFDAVFPISVGVEETQLGACFLLGLYSFVLGLLVRERDKARRLVTMATFEREQRLKDEERIRIATQLHDVMGQYWTAVVRALDVASAVEGEPRVLFIAKARDAAMQGLQEMRAAVHDWHDGRQTPSEWMAYVEQSLTRVREFVGVEMHLMQSPVEWQRFDDAMLVAEVMARTILESVTNAIRHGAATAIHVQMRADTQRVLVQIEDDGSGASEAVHGASGIGLLTMQRLAESVGGEWNMETTRGKGSCVQLTVPYQREDLMAWMAKGS